MAAFNIAYSAPTHHLAGHLKLDLNQQRYADNSLARSSYGASLGQYDLLARLQAEQRTQHWLLFGHYVIAAQAATDAALSTGVDPDRYRLFDLTEVTTDTDRRRVLHRLDRLGIGYSDNQRVIKFGRQAVSWGRGMVYHPFDIFNPFDPLAIDKEFKSGDDLLYGQWLSANGNDWQMILLPRRDDLHDVKADQSSLAIKYHGLAAAVEYDLLVARHYAENILGVGLSYPLAQAMLRGDWLIYQAEDDSLATLALINMDYSWVWQQKNVYGFIELFHNDYGIDNGSDPISGALQARLLRGELFSTARNYLATGATLEWHPLLQFTTTILNNLSDNSALLALAALYDWRQNSPLQFTLHIPLGGRGSEYSAHALYDYAVNVHWAVYF